MIRATITAHIPTASVKELTFQINDRSLGGLALQRQQSFVMTGNRRVQMVSGLLTDRKRPNAIAEDRYQLRQWEAGFRELQTSGLSVFPAVVERENLRADFLVLIDETRFICYTTPRFGIYLHRAKRLFRVQPIEPPAGVPHFFGLDLYTFEVDADDNIMILSPEFVDLFDAGELIDTFGALRQVSTVMTKLSDLAETYGEGLVKPWLAFHIQRLSDDSSGLPLRSHKSFPGKLEKSKVVRLENGNMLIPVKAAPPVEKPQQTDRIHLIEPEPQQIHLESKNGFYPSGSRTMESSEKNTSRLDRLKTKDMASFGASGNRLLHHLMNLVPNNKFLSRLLFFGLILIVILLLVLGGKTLLASRGGDTEPTGTSLIESPFDEEGERSTLKTDYEIEWTVTAQSITLYSEPGGGEPIASVMRGDKVWKLTEAIDDWVLIRLIDGRTGYVYAAMVNN